MDVSDEELPVEREGASSEAGDAASDGGSNAEDEQEDEIDVEDDEQDGLAGDDEEEEQDEVCSALVLRLQPLLTREQLSSSPPQSPPPKSTKPKTTPTKPRLKIKLKFSGVAPSNATPTPSDEAPLRPGRKGHPKRKLLLIPGIILDANIKQMSKSNPRMMMRTVLQLLLRLMQDQRV